MLSSRRRLRRVIRSTLGQRSQRIAFVVGLCVVLVVGTGVDASAAVRVLAGAASLGQVIDNLRNWLIGFLVGLATLFLTIGGIRYLAADGDPGETERAKKGLRNAAIGYAVAILAPLIVAALKSIVGAP